MKNENKNLLYDAILSLKTREECEAFLNDICTINELKSISQRLLVAKMLSEKKVFTEIVKQTGASTATISRVNRCLEHGEGGYQIVLENIK